MANLPTLILDNKSERFNPQEVERLEGLICDYQGILLSKRTDAVSWRQKEDAWTQIHEQFNALGNVPRSIKQLKNKWDNLKRIMKKKASREHILKTGGEPLTPPPPEEEEPSEVLKSISVAVEGHEAIYDDDFIEPKFTNTNPSQDPLLFDVEEQDKENSTSQNEITMFDSSTPHTSLKRPISSTLKLALKKKKVENSQIEKNILIENKNQILTDLYIIEKKKKNKFIAQQEELHEQLLGHNEEIHQLEKKKYFYNEEIQKLDIEKRKIELEILKKQLKDLQS